MKDKKNRQFSPFFGNLRLDENFAGDLAVYCRRVAAAGSLEETEHALVDAACRALQCDFLGYLALSRLNGSIDFYHARGCLPLGQDAFPLSELVQLICTEFTNEFMAQPVRRFLSSSQMAAVFASREEGFFKEGILSTMPSSEGDLVYVILMAFRIPRRRPSDAISFVDTLLSVADLSRRKVSSHQRFKAEHERVVKAKQEWQCSVDVLHELVCLVDASGTVLRANKTLEELGLGRVTAVRGRRIWELLGSLDDQPDAGDSHSADESHVRGQENWTERWQSAVELGHIEWPVSDFAHERRYRISVTPVNLGGPYVVDAIEHAVVVVEDLSRSQALREQVQRESKALTLDFDANTKQCVISDRQLELLSDELLNAQEEERSRIALELHDGLGQELIMLKLRMDCLLQEMNGSPPLVDAPERIKELRRGLQYAIEETRRIGMNLRPPMLDSLGIEPTLQWFLREFAKANPAIEISAEIAIDGDLLISALETEIFRITQEALNNIARHANASHVRYALKSSENWICLVIEDNGDGFHSTRLRTTAAGLRNMLLRATRSGGCLHVQTAPGEGVRIAVDWQL